MKHATFFVAGLAVLLLCGSAAARLPKYAPAIPPVSLAEHDLTTSTTPAPPVRGPVAPSLDDPIGPIDTMGTTWWDEQAFTTCGKQIAVDPQGFTHHVWTNGTTNGSAQRHVYYNAWSPTEQNFIIPDPATPVGAQVNQAGRAGYATVTVNAEGFAFPAFHQVASGTVPHAAVGMDYAPHGGGFTAQEIPHLDSRRIIYPKIACDRTGDLQVFCSEGAVGNNTNLGFYAQGHPWFSGGFGDSITWGGGFTQMDSTHWLSADIAASYRSDRVAVAWVYSDSRSEYGTNVMVRISENRGVTWGDPINVTEFPAIDTNCVTQGGDIAECNADTMRPWVDCSVIFDRNDVVHVAFYTRGIFYWDEDGAVGPWLHNDGVSSIWHWDELRHEYNIIADRPYGTLEHGLGKVQAMVHRPSLAVDTTTGYLYCSYQAFDTAQYSEAGYLQADAWVSVSADGGRTWSAGTNVTATDGGQNTPAGSCRHERDISVAQFVTNGTLHMQYQLDLDAGTGINSEPEGVPTLNPMLYMRIPVDLIPTRPYINPYRVLRQDSTGYPFGLDTTLAVAARPTLQPGEFTLYQNYPNPFNPSTRIQFDLASESVVTLRVFDLLGREVALLADNARLAAGAHVYSFDASTLTSGVYFYELSTPTLRQTRKLVVMK